jgi:hypothetical protein
MTRKELCAAAAINAETFKVHRRTGALPFDPSRHEADDTTGRRWARYSVHEAAALIAARTLADAGLGWSDACAILRGDRVLTGAVGIGAHPAERAGIHVARVSFDTREPVTLQGPLAAIVAAAAQSGEPATLASVDLSRAYTIARERMEVLGLASDPDGSPDPEAAE